MSEPIPAEFKPNNALPCLVCERTPTVDIFVNHKLETHTELCGACQWGEAAAIDPENW